MTPISTLHSLAFGWFSLHPEVCLLGASSSTGFETPKRVVRTWGMATAIPSSRIPGPSNLYAGRRPIGFGIAALVLLAGCVGGENTDEWRRIWDLKSVVSTEKAADRMWQTRDPYDGTVAQVLEFDDELVSVYVTRAGQGSYFVDEPVVESDLKLAADDKVSLTGPIARQVGSSGTYYWALGHDGTDNCFLYVKRRPQVSAGPGYEEASGSVYDAYISIASCRPGASEEELQESVLSMADSIRFR